MLEPRPHGGAIRIGTNAEDFRVTLFQIAGGAGQSPPSPDSGDEGRDLSIGLLPNFGPSGLIMSGWIGEVVELIGPKPTILRCQTLGLAIIIAWIGIGFLGDRNYFSAEHAQ